MTTKNEGLKGKRKTLGRQGLIVKVMFKLRPLMG